MCSAAYLSRDASSRWPSTESMPLSRCRRRRRRRRRRFFVSFTFTRGLHCTPRKCASRGAIENESVEFDIRPTRGVSACRARPTLRAGVFRAALRDRAFESSQRARVPATASSRSRSCPRNTPSALRSGTLSWREIAASNARLRRRTRARGRGESSTRRRRRTASSFDSRRTSCSGAGPKRGSTQGSSPCDRRSDDACDEAGVMTRQRRTSKYAGRVKKAVPTNQIADVSLPVSRRRAGIASRWR